MACKRRTRYKGQLYKKGKNGRYYKVKRATACKGRRYRNSRRYGVGYTRRMPITAGNSRLGISPSGASFGPALPPLAAGPAAAVATGK